MNEAMPPPGFTIDQREDGEGALAFVLAGELDITSASELEETVRARLSEGRAGPIAIDLGTLTFIDSTGLRAIVAVAAACKDGGWDLSIIPGSRAVQRLFELTGLIDVLPFRTADPGNAQR